MAEISKLESKLDKQPATPRLGGNMLASNYSAERPAPGESIEDWLKRHNASLGIQSREGIAQSITEESDPLGKKKMDEFTGRIPGLISGAQSQGVGTVNTYGADPAIYAAIQNRANENFNKGLSSLKNKLNLDEFAYRQNQMNQQGQMIHARRQYEIAKQQLAEAQRLARKAKRGQVLGNVLGVVGAVVGGIFGGPAGASAGMSGGQAIGGMAGSA